MAHHYGEPFFIILIMRLLFLLAFLVLNTAIPAIACEQLVWRDEFDYEGAPNASKWGYDIGGSGWGNNELQYYTNSLRNAFVKDGFLTIKAIKESQGGRDYTSARLITKNKGDWKYGRFEIRAKLPSGRGTWPAIWMLPTDWKYGNWPSSGEIDIMEHVGYDQNTVHGTVHTEAYNHSIGTQKGSSIWVNKASEEFHIYSINWQEKSIEFFVDGVKYFTFTKNSNSYKEWPFDQDFHLLLNIAIGGNWGGVEGVDNSIFPQEMLVDYVRVYKEIDNVEIKGKSGIKINEKNIEYSCPDIIGAKYFWKVPQGVKIINGQGTNSILVDWNNLEGEIKLSVNNTNCTDSVAVISVFFVAENEGIEYLIDDFDKNHLGNWQNFETGIALLNQSDPSEIKYNLSEKASLTYSFSTVHNFSNHTLIKIPISSGEYYASNSKMRVVLIDVAGKETRENAVTFDIIQDKKNRYYSFDLAAVFLEDGFKPEVVKAVKFIFLAGKGHLKFNRLAMYRTDTLPPAPGNLQVSEANGQYQLWWANSLNASAYDVVFSPSENGNYYKVESNIETHRVFYNIVFSDSKKYYRVIARNSSGESSASDFVTLAHLGFNDKLTFPFEIYPNPIHDFISINLNGKKIKTVKLIDLNGKETVLTVQTTTNTAIIKIPETLSNGLYNLVLMGEANEVWNKLIVKI